MEDVRRKREEGRGKREEGRGMMEEVFSVETKNKSRFTCL
jgi:hypothetical protein